MAFICYIGKKSFTDRLYKSGLNFEPNQTREVPDELARRFLKHKDLFELSNATSPPNKAKTDDDTAHLLAQQAKNSAEKSTQEAALQDLYTQVSVMDKDALEQFARDYYQYELNKRKSLENLREEVVGLIDQFGVV